MLQKSSEQEVGISNILFFFHLNPPVGCEVCALLALNHPPQKKIKRLNFGSGRRVFRYHKTNGNKKHLKKKSDGFKKTNKVFVGTSRAGSGWDV